MKLTKLTLGALITASLFAMTGCQSNSNSSSSEKSSSTKTSQVLKKKSSISPKSSAATSESSEEPSSESSQISQSSSSKIVEKKETMPTANELMANVVQFKNANFKIFIDAGKDTNFNIAGSLQENPDLVHYKEAGVETWAGVKYVYNKQDDKDWVKIGQSGRIGNFYPTIKNFSKKLISAMKVSKSGPGYVVTYDGNSEDAGSIVSLAVEQAADATTSFAENAVDDVKLTYVFNANKQLTSIGISYVAGSKNGSFKYTDVNTLPTLSVPQSVINEAAKNKESIDNDD